MNKIAKKDTDWIADQKERMQNSDWIKLSQEIALQILSVLSKKGMSQKDLAEKMGVSPQQISKIVKGNENLTLETIVKLEKCLEIRLVEIASNKNKFVCIEEYSLNKDIDVKQKKYLCSDNINISFSKPELLVQEFSDELYLMLS
ncbi:MAG: transcriptional regulator [Raineya sp.]